jgi:uncharacterized protein YdaU (DUF1376 family)
MEQPLQSTDFSRLCRQVLAHSDEEKEALKYVLGEFFTLTGDVYTHNYCDEQIEKYKTGISAKAKAGVASAEAKKQKAAQRIDERINKKEHVNNESTTEINTCSTAVTNQEPLTINQEPLTNTDTPVSEIESTGEEIPAVCLALRGLGVSIAEQRQNLDKITALVHRGATFVDFTAGLEVAKAANKGFAYALGVVKGRLDDAQNPPKTRASPKQSNMERLGQVKDNSLAERVEQQLDEQKRIAGTE